MPFTWKVFELLMKDFPPHISAIFITHLHIRAICLCTRVARYQLWRSVYNVRGFVGGASAGNYTEHQRPRLPFEKGPVVKQLNIGLKVLIDM